jgi:hypothetical protein
MRTVLLENVKPGDRLEFPEDQILCRRMQHQAGGPDWTNTYASIAGAFYFLKDGAIAIILMIRRSSAHSHRL